MARYPGATWRPVARYQPGGSQNESMARHDCAVGHIEDGTWTPAQAFAHYNTPGNPIPHFRVHTPTGHVDQYVDTRFRSSACLDGNHRCIAWEMHGLGHGDNADPMPDITVEAVARLAAWICKTYDIPARELPDSKPTSRGIGWHRLGIDGNFPQPDGQLLGGRVDGGEHWTTSFGKTCPTSSWIRTYHNFIIPRARQIIEGDDVTPEDIQNIAEAAAREVWSANIGPEGSVEEARERLRGADNQATAANAKIAELATALEAFRQGTRTRHAALVERLKKIAADTSDDATKADLAAAVKDLKETP